MCKREPPFIKGTAQIVDEEGNVIGTTTVTYNNPNYKPWHYFGKPDGNNIVE